MKRHILAGLVVLGFCLPAAISQDTQPERKKTIAEPAGAQATPRPGPASTTVSQGSSPAVSRTEQAPLSREGQDTRYELKEPPRAVVRTNGVEYRGIAVALRRGSGINPLQLINPFAPADLGSGIGHTGHSTVPRMMQDERSSVPGLSVLSVSR
jgi:hypothetical protein